MSSTVLARVALPLLRLPLPPRFVVGGRGLSRKEGDEEGSDARRLLNIISPYSSSGKEKARKGSFVGSFESSSSSKTEFS